MHVRRTDSWKSERMDEKADGRMAASRNEMVTCSQHHDLYFVMQIIICNYESIM